MRGITPFTPAPEPEREVKIIPEPCTLLDVMRRLQAAGVDRGCLVRPQSPTEEAGLIILAIGRAVVELADVIKEAAAKIVGPGENVEFEGVIHANRPVSEIFRIMDGSKKRWVWHFDPETQLLITAFNSQECAEWLAPRLTELGCPTSLT